MNRLAAWLESVDAREAVETLATLVEEAGVFVVDEDRNIVHWNTGAEKLLDLSADAVLGQNCRKANRCRECTMGCGIEKHGAVSNVPLTLYRRQGEAVRVRKSGRAFFDEQGNFKGGIEILVPDAHVEESASHGEDFDGTMVFHSISSADRRMHDLFRTCMGVSATDANVLVYGESGSGKELLARSIHEASSRSSGPFVAVNCAALTPSLMESELFGHVRGAFTGAVDRREGIFDRANGGTLFLDEVAELPLDVQAKLLRVLEERTVTPVGGSKAHAVDVRIVSATHRSLRRAVDAGRFREDLMFRLHVVPLVIPPLRDRRLDVQYLLWRFIREKNRVSPRKVDSVAPDAMRLLLDHRWPGNVRELRNAVEYAFAVGRGSELRPSELPPELRGARGSAVPGLASGVAAARPSAPAAEPEAERIARALEQAGGHIGQAAEVLGMSRPTLWRKRKKYGL